MNLAIGRLNKELKQLDALVKFKDENSKLKIENEH